MKEWGEQSFYFLKKLVNPAKAKCLQARLTDVCNSLKLRKNTSQFPKSTKFAGVFSYNNMVL